MRVHLRVSAKIATYVAERVWHPGQRITRRRDGSLDLRLKTRGWQELVRWILSWQPDVQVVAPAELRKRIEEKLREGLRLATGMAAGE